MAERHFITDAEISVVQRRKQLSNKSIKKNKLETYQSAALVIGTAKFGKLISFADAERRRTSARQRGDPAILQGKSPAFNK